MKRAFPFVLVLALTGCHNDNDPEPQEQGSTEARREDVSSALHTLRQELRYAPADTTAVVSLNYTELLDSKFVANLKPAERTAITESITRTTGIPAADISRLTIFGTANGQLQVVTTRKDLDANQLLEERIKDTAQPTFSRVGQPASSPPAEVDRLHGWKKNTVGKSWVFERDLRFDPSSPPFGHEAFAVPEPRICLIYNTYGTDGGKSMLRGVLASAGKPVSLPASFRTALEGTSAQKTVYVAVDFRDSDKQQAQALAGAPEEVKQLVADLSWITLEANNTQENLVVGQVRLGFSDRVTAPEFHKRLEALFAVLLKADSERQPFGESGTRSIVREVQKSVTWKEANPLTGDFRIDGQDLYLLICSLGQNANATFQKVGDRVGSTDSGSNTFQKIDKKVGQPANDKK